MDPGSSQKVLIMSNKPNNVWPSYLFKPILALCPCLEECGPEYQNAQSKLQTSPSRPFHEGSLMFRFCLYTHTSYSMFPIYVTFLKFCRFCKCAKNDNKADLDFDSIKVFYMDKHFI